MQITMDQSNFKVIYDSKCSITYTLFVIENRYCLQLLVSVKPKIVCDITSEDSLLKDGNQNTMLILRNDILHSNKVYGSI